MTKICLALMNDLGILFPTLVDLIFCFHVEKNIGAKCKRRVLKHKDERVFGLWRKNCILLLRSSKVVISLKTS